MRHCSLFLECVLLEEDCLTVAFNSLLKENVDESKLTTERRENVSLKIAAQPKASCRSLA